MSGGDDGKAVVWDCRTGERLFTLDGHSLPITGLLFAPRAPSGYALGRRDGDTTLARSLTASTLVIYRVWPRVYLAACW